MTKPSSRRAAKAPSQAFNQIAEGLRDAIAYSKGEPVEVRLHVPEAVDVRRVRDAANMTQAQFAAAYGFTVHQLRQWEQGRVSPSGALRAYLLLIQHDPARVRQQVASAVAP
jgi:putative transcriptional regulator